MVFASIALAGSLAASLLSDKDKKRSSNVAQNPAESPGALRLENLADRIGTQAGFQDPAIQQSLIKGLRDQITGQTEQVAQAAGLTGAAQVASTISGALEAMGQGALVAQGQRIQRQEQLLQLQAQLTAQAGGLREQRFETNQRAEQFMAQLKQQRDLDNKSIVPNIVGGALAAFAGGGFGGLFAAGTGALTREELEAQLAALDK